MVNWSSRKLGDWLTFLNVIVAIILLNVVLEAYFFRIDLTQEKRYSVKEQTRDVLEALDDDIYVEVFLEGDLNAEFRRFQKAIAETLEEFRIYSGDKLKYTFTDPTLAKGKQAQAEFMKELSSRGIQPTNVIDNKNGQRAEKIIYPGLVISYGGVEKGITLLKGNKAGSPAEEINQSIEGIEFEIARAISNMQQSERQRVGLITGHGELDSLSLTSFRNDLLEEYDVRSTSLDQVASGHYRALIVAKPTNAFPAKDKYLLDQYIMRGGSVMFLIDRLNANMDSASRDDYFALPYNLDLDDQLFRYGVRINMDLVQDKNASFYPIVTGQRGNQPQMKLLDWPFFPLINHYADHAITRNLDAVITKFASSMDTVKAAGITKTPLLMTSTMSRPMIAPVKVNANDLRNPIADDQYGHKPLVLGYLLEGSFTSLYKNRFLPEGISKDGFIESGKPAKLLVISDGDIIRNDINFRTRQPRQLGFDPATNYTFANKDLLMNAMAVLTDEGGLIQVRNKQVMIRPLDKTRVRDERVKWQVINLVIPLVMIVIYGVGRAYWRKKKFASF